MYVTFTPYCLSDGTRELRRYFIGPLATHLSRSIKVIESDTDRLDTCDFILVIRSNYRPVSFCVRDKRR